jgi:hypothetical protein
MYPGMIAHFVKGTLAQKYGLLTLVFCDWLRVKTK